MTESSRFSPAALFRALRPNQWTKNLLVLAALVFAFGDRGQRAQLGWDAIAASVAAFVLFCIMSSGIYLLNDIVDRRQDRSHPTKRFRPIASGALSVRLAAVTAAVCILAALAGALVVSLPFAEVLVAYALMQAVYTGGLKRIALVDIMVIAAGFVLRALAGAVAIPVTISPWLLLCTFLLALFLALCKRRHEKIQLEDLPGDHRESLGRYNQQLLDQLIAIVSAATIVSYAIYTLWPDTVEKFGTTALGFTIPLVVFGIFRYLDLVYRHDKGDRPEKILLTDIPLLLTIALYGAAVLAILAP